MSMVSGRSTTNAAGGQTSRTVQLPADAQIYVVTGGQPSNDFGGQAEGQFAGIEIWAMFVVDGVRIAYRIDVGEGRVNWQSLPRQTITRQQFDSMGVVDAGSATELIQVRDGFGSYSQYWESLMNQVFGPNNPARFDPQVLAVLAQYAGRPDMTAAELQNLLQGTDWWMNRTESELQWNSLSPAEQNRRREEAAAQISDLYWQLAGQRLDPTDPLVSRYVEDFASGKMSGAEVRRQIRNYALGIEESPAFREDRDEEEAQRQREITIENTQGNIRTLLQRWGLSWTDSEIRQWAESLTANVQSDDDLLNTVKAQAMILYPWKDPDMETMTAAQPWLSTYERVMEQQASLFNPQIQSVLTAGRPVWEWEQELKRSPQWLGTRNAQASLTSTMSQVGQMMGFV